jgi:hypothetical protein
MFDSGVAITFCQYFNDGQPLRRDLVAMILQLLDNGVESLVRICQRKPLFLINNHFQLTFIFFSINTGFERLKQKARIAFRKPRPG